MDQNIRDFVSSEVAKFIDLLNSVIPELGRVADEFQIEKVIVASVDATSRKPPHNRIDDTYTHLTELAYAV